MDNKNDSLPKAIRKSIGSNGKAFLCESRIINILSDLNAFTEYKPAKFILKSIISEGYAEKIIQYKQWDNQVEKLICRFINETALDNNIVYYVFQCISYGLEWTDELPQIEEVNNDASGIAQKSNTPNNQYKAKKKINRKKVEDMTEDEFEDFIWSIMEWDHNLEKKAGVTFSNYFIQQLETHNGFQISFEINGKVRFSFRLCFVFKDEKGRIRGEDGLFILEQDRYESTLVRSDCSLNEVYKIIVNAQYFK